MNKAFFLSELFVSLILFCSFSSWAQNYLTGEIEGVLSPDKYIVSGNLHVLPGKTLTISPGVILNFEPFTGLVVRGKLIADGKPDSIIVFTSVKDGAIEGATPAEFDWNGIDITAEAVYAHFSNVSVRFASIGMNVRSQTTKFVIENAVFNRNGYAAILRENVLMPVADDIAVSYEWRSTGIYQKAIEEPASDATSSRGGKSDIAIKRTEKKGRLPIITLRVGAAAIALGGAVMWIGGHLRAEDFHEEYLECHDETAEGYRIKRDRSIRIRNIGIAVTAAGAAAFGISFFF